MAYYADLREHIKALETSGKLIRVAREINKDTQLMPLVRWQFRGLPADQRKAFLFENVVDVKGKRYRVPVLVAALAASKEIYAMGMMCGSPDRIMDKWSEAQRHPIKPIMVKDGPVHEEVHTGANLLEHGGLGEFPVPISTPGFDNAPYLTAPCWISKDPESGVTNIGAYRAMIKSPTRTGILARYPQHLGMHWRRAKELGKPLQAAIIVGSSPNIGYVSATKIPYEISEYEVAGGIAGEPVKLVKCKTVDLEVPATAEIVIEGEFPTDMVEREGPFGEAPGYMAAKKMSPFFNVTAITHRKDVIFNAWISQMPPSESTVMRSIGNEASHYHFLKHTLGIPGIRDISFHEESGAYQFCVISLTKVDKPQVWRALNATSAYTTTHAKYIIAVDDDIDPHDLDSVIWAIVYRMQPDTDMMVLPRFRHAALDPSAAPTEEQVDRVPTATLLIDATRKWPYPPLSLPRKDFMEEAQLIWEELGLPALKPKVPWFGYSMGAWTEEDMEEADLALQGEYFKTGEKLAKQRARPEEVS